jgi:cell division protein FtsB
MAVTIEQIRAGLRKPKANETPRVDLLERDVFIQFKEIRSLRAENEALKKEVEQLKLENKRLQFENDYLFSENEREF